IVRINIDIPPRKRARGITINEGVSNPPKKSRQEPPPSEKGKRKRAISDRNEIWARSPPDLARVPPASTPTNSVPAQAFPVTPMPPIIPRPRLLNRLKGDDLRTILEKSREALTFLHRSRSSIQPTVTWSRRARKMRASSDR
ncbi:hypothetical protein H5410_055997, partial [Solanum commersonii]